jgi:hypothetical protein
MGHQRKIHITVPICLVMYVGSAELSQQPEWYSIILFPWNWNKSILIVYGCFLQFFYFGKIYSEVYMTCHTSHPGVRIQRPNLYTFKDPRHRFNGINSLWEINVKVMELVLEAGEGGIKKVAIILSSSRNWGGIEGNFIKWKFDSSFRN